MDYRYNPLGNGVLNTKYRLRNRLRYCIWHHWKKVKRRCRVYLVLGQNQEMLDAGRIVGKEVGGNCPNPNYENYDYFRTFERKGYVSLLEVYVHSIHNPVNRRV